ncbi:MAG: divalent-cation tolerance protein CutA [Acidobacteria bacterium]|nr:divalent-cation tolerance protein CutA [Acidobacteriota bacterium]
MMECVIVLTTIPAEANGAALADALIAERLAACVSIAAPMESTYRWKGAITHDTERQIVIKTVADRLPALEARLRELHPYEVPEFLVLQATASEPYGRWVLDETIVQ